MGQKVNPIGLRIGINKQWSSLWYANKSYPQLVQEDLNIRNYINKKFEIAGIADIVIERAANNLKINIYAGRPGIIIGKKGVGAEGLKEEIKRMCKLSSGDIVLNVFEIKKPDLNAKLVALNIKSQLERRVSFRRAMKKAISSAIKNGAKGIKISCSGRLGGADMARVERYMEGRVPLHTLRSDVDYAKVEAYTTYGLLGIKVWIFKGDVITGF